MRTAVACFLLSIGVALAAAAVAIACTPMAFLTLDRPTYQPGEPFAISGAQFDPQAATPVTLRWGDGGPVIGSTPVGPDGSVSFAGTVPADAAAGTYVLYAEAYGPDGQLVPGLPARVALPVASAAPAQSAPPALPPVREEPSEPARSTPAASEPARSTPAASAAPARSRVERPPAAAVAPAASAPAPAPVAAASAPATAEAITPPTLPTRTNVIRHRAPQIERVSLPPAGAPGDAPPLPVAAAAAAGNSGGGTPWSVLVLGGLALLAFGGAAGALAARPGPPPAPPADDMDAALQELLAEERAKRPYPSERR